MKWWGIAAVTCLLATACGSKKHVRYSNGKTVQLVYDEPDYKKDRRLEQYVLNRTNSHGASGVGSGGSFSSYSYRQSAIRALNDTIPDFIEDRYAVNDSINSDSISVQEDWNDMAADSSDAEFSW